MCRPAVLLAMLALTLATFAKEPASRPAPPEEIVEDRVTVETPQGVTSVAATVAGKILALSTPRAPGGARELVLLVAPPAPPAPTKQPDDPAPSPAVPCDTLPATAAGSAAPRRLVRLDLTGAGSLTTLREDLPGDARNLVAADLDGDGVDELLLLGATGVGALRDDGSRRFAGAPRSIVESPQGELEALLPGVLRAGDANPALVSIAALGSLRTYGGDADGAFALRSTVDLPLLAKRESHGLELSSPTVQKLDAGAGVDLLVVDPEPRGSERLRSFVIRLGAVEQERRQEAWLKLPGAERVLETSFLVLDGRPALVVTTMPAAKLSFFGEKLLRVFFLEGDRTRAGKAPLVALQTNANLWQALRVVAIDVSGDGKQDLVLGYWKGLKDDTLVLDAYLRRPDGTFERNPRSTQFDVENANRAILLYGNELDGRGLADLVLLAGGKLTLYPGGDPGSQGRKLVAAKPSWSVPVRGTVKEGREMSISLGSDDAAIRELDQPSLQPIVVDIDGDGQMEIVVTGDGGVPGHVLAILPAR